MNSIWLKIAVAVVAVFIVIVVIGKFKSGEPAGPSAPRPESSSDQPKTVYDQWEEDDEKYSVRSQETQPAQPEPQVAQATEPETATQPQASPPQPAFEKLAFEQEVQAQKLFEHAKMEFKQSRLPIMTPARMVKDCREIIQRWPKSEYAFQAKRMLADLPQRYHTMYKITDQEKDVSSFYK